MKKKAICLLSGGLDSTTALYSAVRDGYRPLALTLEYGQRHAREVRSARDIAKRLGIEWQSIPIRLPWGGSALLDGGISVPLNRAVDAMSREIPATYVPARNTIFLSFAFSWAEAAGAEAVVIGANAVDYSGYPDCRPEYLETMEEVFRKATKTGAEGGRIKILAPLLRMTKAEIVKFGKELGVPFERTWSCYLGGETPCGRCDSCLLRAKGFEEAGVADPLTEAAAR